MALPVKVKEGDMESFVRKLKLDLPASIKVHNVAVNVLSGRWPYSEFWVDRWPDFNAAIAVPNKDANPSFECCHVVYGTEMSVTLLLQCCVKWKGSLSFLGVHEDLYPALIEVAKSHNFMETVCVVNNLFIADYDQIKSPALMEGYTSKSLCSEDVPHIVKNWYSPNQHNNPSEYVNTIVSCFPTIGVFDCNGDLVGHAGLYDYGAVGILVVVEKHRRKGLGKYMLSKLFEIGGRSGISPHSNVVRGNVGSENLHRAAGIPQHTTKSRMFVFLKCNSTSGALDE